MAVIQPFGDRVLVRLQVLGEVTDGGLYVPPTSAEASNRGTIEALGDDIEKLNNLSVGDEVLFMTGCGTKYTTNLTEYRIVSSREILGKIIKGAENE